MRRQRVGYSLADDIHGQLREEILGGALEPGDRLLVQPLSQRFQVSLSVVREALTRLAEQGLAKSTPQVGFTVTPLSVEDLLDLTRVRVDIESLMIRRAIAEGDLTWESSVVAAFHTLAGTDPADPRTGRPNPAWRPVYAAFHGAVAAGCESPLLQRIRAELYDKAELYRAWSVRANAGRDVATEHRRICEAVLERDAVRSTVLMAEHIELTTQLVMQFLEEQTAAGRSAAAAS